MPPTDPKENDGNKGSKNALVPGLAIFGCFITGIMGLLDAGLEMSVGSGIGLLAAALAFGIIVFVSFRD